MRVVSLFVVLLAGLLGLTLLTKAADHSNDLFGAVKTATGAGEAVLLEVLEKPKWHYDRLKDAKLLPSSVLTATPSLEEALQIAPKANVVCCHCRSGVCSSKATGEMAKLGYDFQLFESGYSDLLKVGFQQVAPSSADPKPVIKDSVEPDVELELTAAPEEIELFKGRKTPVWRYTGKVLKGRKQALVPGDGYLGPTIHLIRGERVRVHFVNKLSEPSIIHWHGLIVPHEADGLPSMAIKPNERKTYDFTVVNRAGTYVYHPHAHMYTAGQVYRGLVGVIIIHDPEEDKIGLPSGTEDLCVVIQDRRVDADNKFVYSEAMMDMVSGMRGETILVNGRPDAAFRIERRPYRLRLVNASNARIYKLAWSDGSPMHVIGTDGGLLSGDEGPQQRPFVVLGPFERVELWEDFSRRKPGAELSLISEKFAVNAGMGGRGRGPGMGMMMMTMMNMGGEKLQIARMEIQEGAAKPGVLPKLPGTKPKLAEAKREVKTTLAFRMMRGFLNGRQYNNDELLDSEKFKLNEPVIWAFDNGSQMGMQLPHPIHIHGVQFRVIERNGNGPGELAKGVIDDGWKDTVLIFPGETVKLYLQPTERGLFVYHCHILEHADMGMMRHFQVADE